MMMGIIIDYLKFQYILDYISTNLGNFYIYFRYV